MTVLLEYISQLKLGLQKSHCNTINELVFNVVNITNVIPYSYIFSRDKNFKVFMDFCLSSKINILKKLNYALSRVFLKWRFLTISRINTASSKWPLLEIVPLSSIEAASKEVKSIVSQVEKSSSENDPEGNSATAESKAMKRAYT